MIKFDKQQYLEDLDNPAKRYEAKKRLESAIKTAPIEQAIELKKLRTPETVCLLEIVRLRNSGFDMDKKTNGIEDCLTLAFNARDQHAKKYWPNWKPYA